MSVFDQVDNLVLGVMMHTNRRINFHALGRKAWIVRDNIDDLAQALRVVIRLLAAEIHKTVIVTIKDIGVCLLCEFNFHVVRVYPHAPVPRSIFHRVTEG